MLFDVLGLVDETTARSIAFAVHAADPQAKITANLARGRLLVESELNENTISDALRAGVTACHVDRAPRKNPQPSDHAPVVASLA